MKSAAEEEQQSYPEAHDKYSNDINPPFIAVLIRFGRTKMLLFSLL